MRRIPFPGTDDESNLKKLKLSRAASAKSILPLYSVIQQGYQSYVEHEGDPWQVTSDVSCMPLADSFHDLYERPPVALKSDLQSIRAGLTGACPMCGRDSLGTLDHFLPKANYPEFSFFSRNLVPACSSCNTHRSTSVKGHKVGHRALHPYFDIFADQRVMTVELSPPWIAPTIKPVPYAVLGTELDIVTWQIANVILPSGFIAYASPIWATLVRGSVAMLGTSSAVAEIESRLEYLVTVEELNGQSKNGWRSCIYHGIRHCPDAVAHLASCVQANR